MPFRFFTSELETIVRRCKKNTRRTEHTRVVLMNVVLYEQYTIWRETFNGPGERRISGAREHYIDGIWWDVCASMASLQCLHAVPTPTNADLGWEDQGRPNAAPVARIGIRSLGHHILMMYRRLRIEDGRRVSRPLYMVVIRLIGDNWRRRGSDAGTIKRKGEWISLSALAACTDDVYQTRQRRTARWYFRVSSHTEGRGHTTAMLFAKSSEPRAPGIKKAQGSCVQPKIKGRPNLDEACHKGSTRVTQVPQSCCSSSGLSCARLPLQRRRGDAGDTGLHGLNGPGRGRDYRSADEVLG
ncbi:hypothetical protein C8R43DRAFT_1106084 [Mycena crocata]|nr:hypothetical protein C8R43DRAFT_1106084 [Mycena crocata]